MNSIDQRIVKMKFDNAQFESGIKTSLSSLDKLKNSLNMSGAAQGLDKLKNSTKGFTVANITDGVNELSLKFSALGVMGATVISNITTSIQNKLASAIKSTIGLISSGGMRRAMNLEQANFSMQGLLNNSKEVAKVMGPSGPVQAAVDGTAYGLDSAAVAASNLLAAGVGIDDLEKPLKTISGLAAQTGRSYEEMSDVIVDSYAKGKVQGYEIQRLSQRGINAIAELQKFYRSQGLEYTADEIQKMSQKGEIAVDDFTNALFHFYDNAARANDTYSGSLSNLKAALSRLGAKFSSPYLENMRDIFNSLRPLVNSISKALDPFIEKWNELFKSFTKFSVLKIDGLKSLVDNLDPNVVTNAANAFGKLTSAVEKLWQPKKMHDLREQVDDLTNGLSKVERIKLKKQLEDEAVTPIERIINAFKNFGSALKNVISGIENLITPIIKTIKDFVGPMQPMSRTFEDVSLKVKALSESFKLFTQSLKFQLYIVEPLKTVFLALANVIGILISAGKLLATTFVKNVLPIFGYFGVAISKLIKIFANFVINISNIINENLLLEKAFSGLGSVFDTIGSKLKGFLTTTNPIILGFSKLTLSVERFFSGLADKGVASVIDRITNLFKKFGDVVSKIAQIVGSKFLNIGERISDTFDPKRITGLASLGTLVANGGILYLFISNLKKLRETLFSLGGPKDAIQNFIDGLSDLKEKLLGMSQDLDPAGIKEIALAIAIMAGSLVILSMVDPNKLAVSTVALGAIVVELIAAIKQLDEITSDKQQAANVKKMAGALIVLSGAILIISVAFKKLGELEWDQIAKGTIAIGSLLTMLGIYTKAMSEVGKNEAKVIKAGGTLIALSIAVNLLASAVKKLGELDAQAMVNGLISVGGLLLTIGLFTKYAEADRMSLSAGLGLIGLSVAINILARAVEKFGEMDPKTVAKGLSFMALALMEVLFAIDMIDGKKVLSSSIAVTIISASLLLLATGIEKLGKIPLVELVNGLVAMAVALSAIVLAVNLMPATSILSAAAIVAIAGGILVLASALKVMSTIPFESMMLSIVSIAGVLITFGIASSLMGPVIPIMLGLAAAIALLGAGMAAAAIAITLMTPVLIAFSTALVGSAEIILAGIITLGDQLYLGIIAIISSISTALLQSYEEIVSIVSSLIKTILEAVQQNVPLLLETVGVLLDALLNFIIEYIPKIAATGLEIVLGIVQAIADNIQELVEAGAEIAINFINGVANKLPDIIEAGYNLLLSYMQGITNAINEHSYEIGEAAWDLAEALINGMIDGIAGFMSKPIEKIKEFGTGVLDGLKEILGINSPSKETEAIAKDTITGFQNGLSSNEQSAFSKVTSFASGILKKIKDKLTKKSSSQYGKDAVSGISSGMESEKAKISNTTESIIKSVLDKFKQGLSANQTKQYGTNVITGIVNGMSAQQNSITSKIATIVSSIKSKLSSLLAASNFKLYGTNIVNGISNGINNTNINSKITSLVSTIKNKLNGSMTSATFKTYGSNVSTGISNGMSTDTVRSKASSVASTVKDNISSVLTYSTFYTIGSNITSGLKAGINSNTYTLYQRAEEIADNIVTTIKKALNINSPSKVTIGIGESIIEGLDMGLAEDEGLLGNAKKLAKSLTKKISDNINDTNTFEITPVLNLSEIQNGVSSINRMFGGDSIGSVAANVNSLNNITVASAFDKLSALIGGLPGQLVDSEEIYEAVREGASNAVFNVILDGERLTSTINSRNNDTLNTAINFYGG